MDISARTEYAVQTMLELAQAHRDDAGPVSGEALATAQQLPRKFLEAILADLRRGGLVTSTRGARGGYELARPPREITLGQVFRVVDGPLAEIRGGRPQGTSYQGAAQHLPTVWVAVRASLRQVLDGVDLDQVLTGELSDEVRRLAALPDAWRDR